MNQKDIASFINGLKSSSHLELKIKGSRNNAPLPIHYYNSKKKFIPDVVVSYANKRDYYVFESVIEERDISHLMFKWILFSAEARKLNGKFYLVVDKTNVPYCKNVIIDKQLDVELVEL